MSLLQKTVQFVYGMALVRNVFAPLLVHTVQRRQPVQNLQRMKGKLVRSLEQLYQASNNHNGFSKNMEAFVEMLQQPFI